MSTFEGNNGRRVKAGVRGCYLHGDLYPQHTCKQTSQRSIGVALEVKR